MIVTKPAPCDSIGLAASVSYFADVDWRAEGDEEMIDDGREDGSLKVMPEYCTA